MKNHVWRRTAMALALCVAPSLAVAANEIVAGVVIAIEGKPSVKPAGKTALRALKRNQFVNEGDQILTRVSERVAIAFTGGAEIRIDENSAFTINNGGGQKPTKLSTVVGKAWTRLLHGNAGVDVRTPVAVAAVRGTEADIESAERTMVKVYEGHVDLVNDHGKQSLKAGQMSQVASANVAPEPPKTMGPQDVGTWQEALKATGDVDKQIMRLRNESDRRRKLELKTKNGKTLRFDLEKK